MADEIENDWAWDEAVMLMGGHDSEGVLDLTAHQLAAALRKARASGQREAASLCDLIAKMLRERADKAETPEPYDSCETND